MIERGQQQIDQFLADAGIAAGQRIGAGDHDGARLGRGEQNALTHGQVMQEVGLMLRQVGLRDAKAAQRTKACVDAVDGAGFGGE